MVNSILYNNTPIEIFDTINAFYSDIKGGWSGEGNIDLDPLFRETGDFRLQEESPCIDTGTDFFVFNGDTLVNQYSSEYNGAAPDMGAYEFGDPAYIEVSSNIIPSKYSLSQNYPNPFNPSTSIKYDLPKASDVRIEVYNITGQNVEILLNQQMKAGHHEVEFNAQNFSSGVYFYKIEAGEFQDVKKMILIR
jgi:hypothetical protein